MHSKHDESFAELPTKVEEAFADFEMDGAQAARLRVFIDYDLPASSFVRLFGKILRPFAPTGA